VSRLSQLTVPSMPQSVASTAAKSSFVQITSNALVPPPPVAVKKDPKLANNWKAKSAEELTDAEVIAMPDSEYMNDKQMAFFRLKLQELKRGILENAGETTEHLREDTVVVPDPADRATIEEEHALELRTRDRERKLLKKIEQSIQRIDAGDYGYRRDRQPSASAVAGLAASHAVARGATPRAQAEDVGDCRPAGGRDGRKKQSPAVQVSSRPNPPGDSPDRNAACRNGYSRECSGDDRQAALSLRAPPRVDMPASCGSAGGGGATLRPRSFRFNVSARQDRGQAFTLEDRRSKSRCRSGEGRRPAANLARDPGRPPMAEQHRGPMPTPCLACRRATPRARGPRRRTTDASRGAIPSPRRRRRRRSDPAAGAGAREPHGGTTTPRRCWTYRRLATPTSSGAN
jgi:DnaK suppressor protein